jgi:hypothetical protein
MQQEEEEGLQEAVSLRRLGAPYSVQGFLT